MRATQGSGVALQRRSAWPTSNQIRNDHPSGGTMIESGLGGMRRLAWLGLFALAATSSSSVPAQAPQADVLQVPAKSVPVPGTVSPQLAKIIGMPLRNGWDVLPKTGEEWVPIVQATAAATLKNVPGMQERLREKFEKTTITWVG